MPPALEDDPSPMADDIPDSAPDGLPADPPTKLRFYLKCETDRSLFILSRDGERWHQYFNDVSDALADAASRVTEETPIIVTNAAGEIILESVIAPKLPKSTSPRRD